MLIITKLLFGFVVNICSAFYQAWVMCLVWSWFIMNHFHLGELSLTTAIGLSLFMNFFVNTVDSYKITQLHDKLEVDSKTKWWVELLLTPALATILLCSASFYHFIVIPILGVH